MIISYKWLQKYIKEPLPGVEEIEEKLNLHAFEIEDREEKNGDTLFDVKILPNRSSDCLSHTGIAMELATLFNLTFVPPEMNVKGESDLKSHNLISLSIEDPSKCRRAMKRLVTDVKIGLSPEWLVTALEALGQRSINNVVDSTNFVMLELGTPVHAFDYDKLVGEGKKDVIIRNAKEEEQITLLDDKEYTLDPSVLVIADSEKALDVAGIKGGKYSSLDGGTTRVMLSVCSFDPTTIRRAGTKLGLRTDALKRFENNVPPEMTAYAIDRLTHLIEEIAGGKATSDVVDEYLVHLDNKQIEVSVEEINNLLGSSVDGDIIENICKRLNFEVVRKDEIFTVTAPCHRTDIMIKEDVIEEVGRIYGYNNIESVLPTTASQPVEIEKIHYYTEKIKDVLVSEGFSEVYTYSFVENGDIEVKNKIASDKGFLRSNLRKGVGRALELNAKNVPLLGTDILKVFEIGKVFTSDREFTSLVIGVKSMAKKEKGEEEALEGARKSLRVLGIELEEVQDGIIEINLEEAIKSLSEPQSFDIQKVEEKGTQFKAFSLYPYVLRDIAVWVPESVHADDLLKVIRNQSNEWLVQSKLFDEFHKDERVSYAYNLVFQSHEKTLTDEEVNKIMQDVYSAMKEKGWEVR